MQIGFVGLGRMGGNMVSRIHRDSGHQVVAFDHSEASVRNAESQGALSAVSLEDLVARLDAPRAVWLMIPAGDPTQQTVDRLADLLDRGDLVVDGGNSNWRDDERRAATLSELGILYADVGTSGGVWGLEVGYCMMAGGSEEAIARIAPVLDVLAPPTTEESRAKLGDRGWAHMGPAGAGHFVKMVHNGVEYGMMQAYAEGFQLFAESGYDLDNAQIAHLWQQGSVVRSWLCELAARAFETEGNELESLRGFVDDSGEGRWTLEAAIDLRVPLPVIGSALFARFYSRELGDYSHRVLAALRNQFGGHPVERAAGG